MINFNYLSGNSQKTTRTTTARGSVKASEGATSDLKGLSPGKAFNGTITDVKNDQVYIKLENGQTMAARLESDVEFFVGQTVTFQVKSNNGSQIALKPMPLSNFNNPTLLKVVDQAGLSANEQNLGMVKAMMDAQLPVNKQAVMDMFRQMARFPDVDVNTLIQMNKLSLPVTEETVAQFESYQNYEHQIYQALESVSEEIPKVLEEMVKSVATGQALEGGGNPLPGAGGFGVPSGALGDGGVFPGNEGVLDLAGMMAENGEISQADGGAAGQGTVPGARAAQQELVTLLNTVTGGEAGKLLDALASEGRPLQAGELLAKLQESGVTVDPQDAQTIETLLKEAGGAAGQGTVPGARAAQQELVTLLNTMTGGQAGKLLESLASDGQPLQPGELLAKLQESGVTVGPQDAQTIETLLKEAGGADAMQLAAVSREQALADSGNLSDNLQQILEKVGDFPENPQQALANPRNLPEHLQRAMTFHEQISNIFQDSQTQSDPVGQTLSKEECAALAREFSKLNVPKEVTDQLLEGKLTGREALEAAKDAFSRMSETAVKENGLSLFSSKVYHKLLKNEVLKEWLIRPQELSQENKVEELYQRLQHSARQLEAAVNSLGQGREMANLLKSAANIRENVDFMNQLNQMFTYIQLPLKMRSQNAHSELYVYTNKKNLRERKGDITALLHLDMETLKSVDIFVKLSGKSLETKFYLEDEKSFRLLEAHSGELIERLERKGYSCSVEFEGAREKRNFFEELMAKEHGEPVLRRYSFDARA